MQVHHVIPLYNYADTMKAHALSNLVCLCGSCHSFAEREVHHQRLFSPRVMALKELDAWITELIQLVRPRAWTPTRSRHKELGVSRKAVNSWIKRTRRPRIEQFFALKAFLKKQQRRKKPEAE